MPASPKGSTPTTAPRRIVLLDAHAIIHRAYHALPDFTSPQGEPVGGLFGLASMLFSIIEELKPDHLFACYDLPEKTFRHEAYENYKAGRQEADDALVAQLIRSRDVFHACGIEIYEKAGFEADDLLGTLAAHFKQEKENEIIIASGDMDTLQLVDGKRVRVYTLRKGLKDTVMYDEAAVEGRFGFPPTLLPDFKGLRGDPSDNIPGIPGIGEKTATTLITSFGSLEAIYKTLADSNGEERFSQAGITPRIIGLLREHEDEALFSKELATIRTDVDIDITLPRETWRQALDPERVLALFGELGFRTLSQRFRSQFDVPTSAKARDQEEHVDPTREAEAAVMLWLLHSDTTNPTLDDIYQHTGAATLRAAHAKLREELSAQDLLGVFERIEQPLIPIIARMEARGVLIDREHFQALSREYGGELMELEQQIHEHAGHPFNVNSPRQLGTVLFDELALTAPRLKKTATGQRSTRESELEKLRDAHPIVPLIFEYRELQKLLSTYIDVIPQMADEGDRLHTNFSQTGTTTGRMSSQHPNLQNLPIRSERGRRIRRGIIAPAGFTLAAFDYSQVELRIAAFLSGDEHLARSFREGVDIHTTVAAYMFDVAPEDVDPEMRRRAKVINFGILYGMGVNALSQNLGVERKEAQEYLTAYFQNFAQLADYLEQVKQEARRTGYTRTFFGRKRHFEGIRSHLSHVSAHAERMAINAPIQGTQADITKLAMIAVDALIETEGWRGDVFPILQIHDELIFEVRADLFETVAPQIQETMQGVISTEDTNGIPLKVDIKHGPSWGELE
ncbi:hypothetical protein GVX82_03190 [Patescibacteria group bacterium]|jgi:DNA polymerase-1|nr:hypothetical protein [Patescibacteria group bacterium]